MKIAIIGFSRFGQFWAKTLKPFGEIVVFNRSDKSKEAKEIGVRFYKLDNLKEIKGAKIIFICIAISATEEIIKKILAFINRDVIVADTCSVKIMPCRWLKKHLKHHETIGTHPMFGPDSAKSGLEGKQIILCPIDISKSNFSKLKKIFKKLKLKIVQITPEEHDRQSAFSLCMVHFLGRGLDRLRLDKIQIKTQGFERLMQLRENVRHDSWRLFEDMQKFNPYAKEARQKLIRALREIDNLV